MENYVLCIMCVYQMRFLNVCLYMCVVLSANEQNRLRSVELQIKGYTLLLLFLQLLLLFSSSSFFLLTSSTSTVFLLYFVLLLWIFLAFERQLLLYISTYIAIVSNLRTSASFLNFVFCFLFYLKRHN